MFTTAAANCELRMYGANAACAPLLVFPQEYKCFLASDEREEKRFNITLISIVDDDLSVT
jgi:hypothetical protein